MTKKACEGGGENDFLSALGQASNFKVDKNKLTLLDSTKELISFLPQAKQVWKRFKNFWLLG